MDYVLGFAFSPQKDRVVLIQKSKTKGPEAIRGLWNGIGGKIERKEAPEVAMQLEFCEEAGVIVEAEQWEHYCTLSGLDNSWNVTVFRTVLDEHQASLVHTAETEEVRWISAALPDVDVVPNVLWLLPMARIGGFTGIVSVIDGPYK